MSALHPVSILLGTGNSDKQRMLRWLLTADTDTPVAAEIGPVPKAASIRPVTPAELGVTADPDESGATHESIARAKAEAWSLTAGMPAIASDGGLLVPVLGANWESRYTRRFAGPAADDRERQRRLLDIMSPYAGCQRDAAFVEGLAIAVAGQTVASWEVRGATGRIATRLPAAATAGASESDDTDDGAAPADGFWVFPIWHFAQFGRTYDRLTQAERASLGDHWDALRTLAQQFLADWPP